MLGILLFILLLPVTLYFLTKIILDDDSKPVVFLENWMYSNLYHFGVLLGAISRLFVPIPRAVTSEETEDAKQNAENELVRGIKQTWK